MESSERNTQPASDRFQLKWHLQEHGWKSVCVCVCVCVCCKGDFFLSGELFTPALVKKILSHFIIYFSLKFKTPQLFITNDQIALVFQVNGNLKDIHIQKPFCHILLFKF